MLAGCALIQDPGPAPATAPAPPARPAGTAAASGEQARLAAFFREREQVQLDRGLRRLDSGAAEMPTDPDKIADIYVQVALRDEYRATPAGFVPSGAPAPLRRWERPVAFRLGFGASVPDAVQARDRAEAARLVATLAQATGHPVRLLPESRVAGGNFHVLILNPQERQQAEPRLRALVPGIDEATVSLFTALPLSVYCVVAAFARGDGTVYTDAIAMVRAELPELTRHACLHEEMAQGLGLPNDSDIARPSIFNDDQEFARLTELDLMLLRIHYDPRLRPGMRAAQARPIVRQIAVELLAATGAS